MRPLASNMRRFCTGTPRSLARRPRSRQNGENFRLRHDAGATAGQFTFDFFVNIDLPSGRLQHQPGKQAAHRAADDDGAALALIFRNTGWHWRRPGICYIYEHTTGRRNHHGIVDDGKGGAQDRPFGLARGDRQGIRARARQPEPLRRYTALVRKRAGAGVGNPPAARRAGRLPPPCAGLFLDLGIRRTRSPACA